MAYKKYALKSKRGMRKNTKKPKKYQNYKRKNKYTVKPHKTQNLGIGLPSKVLQTMKYEETYNITSTGGALTVTRFSANGLYDTNTSGVGHQPMYFDQMTALYNHYVVLGSKMKATVVNQTSSGVAGEVGLHLNDDTSVAVSDISGIGEQTYDRTRVIAGGMNSPVYLTQKYSAKRVHGGNILSNNALQGTAAANPTEQTYFDICYQAYGGATNAITVKVNLEFIVMWTELKDVAQS